MSELKIAIIGAGPAGCMLARLLHLADIPVTIFEGESAPDFRSQGGTLDLHTDTGLRAIKRADLYSEFLKYARFDGEAFALVDKNLVKYLVLPGTKEGSSRGRPEIDRSRLRELLVESLPPACVVWGKRLKSVGSDLTLNFEESSEKGFDLIVGADGAFSKVRPVLSSTNPIYSGIAGYQASIEDAKFSHPDLYKLVNRGSLFSHSDHKFLSAQQMGDGSLSVGAWLLKPERRSARIDISEAKAAKDSIKEEFRDWTPQLVDFISRSADNSLKYLPLYMLPVGHSWEHRPGVTLLGDAAHLMTPFAGEGVNLAFADAIALADAIIKTSKSLEAISTERNQSDVATLLSQNIRAFEVDMFERATKVQQHTFDMMHAVFFMQGPARRTIRRYVLCAVSDGVPSIFYPLVVALVYIYFFVHRLLHFRLERNRGSGSPSQE